MTAVRRIRAAALPDLPDASWSNALLVGEELVMRDAHAQALVVLGKVKALLEAAGGHVGNLYKLNVYVTRIADKDAIGRARQEFFAGQGTFPASTLVEVSGLVFPELLVEIDAWARLDIDLANCDEA